MSKVASYLRGHLSGEVVTRQDVRSALSSDAGILSLTPDMVIYPHSTNDIRKVARFSWQLAEKGHVLPVTVRGGGTDTTGAAIGRGIVLATDKYMDQVFEFDPKQRLVRLQPGASISSVRQSLSLSGGRIPSLDGSHGHGTIAGAIASGVGGPLAGKYGTIEAAVDQLEVVLANGDILQTGRLTKREFEKRKGIQGFVGDIYRGVDSIIEDYADVLDGLRSDDSTGYNSIADVKRTDGSFDLTPLFVGSQGTLGIISEMIMKTEPKAFHYALGAFVYESAEAARDAFDVLSRLDPPLLDYYDASFFSIAKAAGKTYEFYEKASEAFAPAAVILIGFDDTSAHKRSKHIKKLRKIAAKTNTYFALADETETDNLLSVREVVHYAEQPDKVERAAVGLYTGFQVPGARFDEFYNSLQDLATKLHVALPLTGHIYTGVYSVYPSFDLKKVGDKQKIFKLLDELSALVIKHGGAMISEGGEGRLKGKFVYANLDEKLIAMYEDVKKVFDPRGIFNPGVKMSNDVKTLVELTKK